MNRLKIFFVILTVAIAADRGMSDYVVGGNYLDGFDKFTKLAMQTRGQRRVILVGGSSLGWGVSAETLTKQLGITTLNAGLHAGVGFENFIRLVEPFVDADKDLLVYSPEYNILDASSSVRNRLFCYTSVSALKEYPPSCTGFTTYQFLSLPQRLAEAGGQTRHRYDGFNDYGDYTYRQPGVSIQDFGRPPDFCSKLDPEVAVNTAIRHLNTLVKKGYEILYVPNFLYEKSCSTPKALEQIDRELASRFGAGTPSPARIFYEGEYFYDTPYHLNKRGVSKKTSTFLNHVEFYLNSKNHDDQ